MGICGGRARFAVLVGCLVGYSVELAAERLAFDNTLGGPREWGFRPGGEDLPAAESNERISFKSSPLGKQSHGNEVNNSFELYDG